MTRLAFCDVAVARGGQTLLRGLSFALLPGEAALVRGPNGAGKTSLIRVAAGLLAPAQGRIERSGRIGWLGEAAALDGELPLARAFAFWAHLDGTGREAVAGALEVMGIGALAAVPVAMLSTGQRRRAALARIVAGGAALWLLDEPANGLDTDGVARLEAAVARHRAAGGIALVATHQPVALPGAAEVRL